MVARRSRLLLVGLAVAVATTGCSRAAGDQRASDVAAAAVAAAPTTAQAPTTTEAPTTTVPPTTAPPPRAVVAEAAAVPFAVAGGITLFHPSTRVERVGFHESNHDGARPLEAQATAASPVILEARERGTGGLTAADIVVDPDADIRSPVSGTIKRGGGYTLYCKYSDNFVVIAPDANPAWEVKILHISGLRVRRGQRVVAGETVVADRPTILPFASQVDDVTYDPAWPHVHLEVVDPSIKDRPNPNSGGC